MGLAQCPGEGRARLGRAAGHRRHSKEALSGVPAGAGVHPRGSPSLNCAPRAPHSSLGTEGRGTRSHRISSRGDWRGSEVRPKAKAFVTLGTVFPLSPFLVSSLMGFSLKVSERTDYPIVKEEREIHPYRAMKARGRSQAKSRVSSLCPAEAQREKGVLSGALFFLKFEGGTPPQLHPRGLPAPTVPCEILPLVAQHARTGVRV